MLTAALATLKRDMCPSKLDISKAWPRAVLEYGEYTRLAVSEA